MTKDYRYPNILQSIWILILLEILFRGSSFLLYFLWRTTDFLLLFHDAVSLLMRVIVVGLILTGGLKRAHTSFREICPLAPIRLSLLFPMALTAIGTFMLVLEVNYWLKTLLLQPESYTKYRWLEFQISFWDSVGSVVIGPLTEELLVRGLILHGFLSRYSARKAVLASALWFGLMHLDPWNFIGPTVGGILYAWWLIQTRSMLPCFFGHALHNALATGYNVLLQSEIGFRYQGLWWNLVGVILTALGIWLLIRQFRKSSDTVPEDVAGDRPEKL